jgi:toxin ParE1/3/4
MTVVSWSQKAKARLRQIYAYVAEDSPLYATRLVDRLTQRAGRLGLEPYPGRRVPEYPEEDLREVLERPYRLIFRASPGRIDILTVKHYRQRLPLRVTEL